MKTSFDHAHSPAECSKEEANFMLLSKMSQHGGVVYHRQTHSLDARETFSHDLIHLVFMTGLMRDNDPDIQNLPYQKSWFSESHVLAFQRLSEEGVDDFYDADVIQRYQKLVQMNAWQFLEDEELTGRLSPTDQALLERVSLEPEFTTNILALCANGYNYLHKTYGCFDPRDEAFQKNVEKLSRSKTMHELFASTLGFRIVECAQTCDQTSAL